MKKIIKYALLIAIAYTIQIFSSAPQRASRPSPQCCKKMSADDREFKALQESIRARPEIRVPNWNHLYTTLDLSALFCPRSNCGNSADVIWEIFTGTKYPLDFAHWAKQTDPNNPLSRDGLHEYEFLGNLKKFEEKNESGYINPIAQKLLKDAGEDEHYIFYIMAHKNNGQKSEFHTFTVQKKGTSIKTCWRLFHAWHSNFTVAQWAGVDAWQPNCQGAQAIRSCREIYRKYNPQKLVSCKDIKSFIDNPLFLSPDENRSHDEYRYYIRMAKIITPAFMPKPKKHSKLNPIIMVGALVILGFAWYMNR